MKGLRLKKTEMRCVELQNTLLNPIYIINVIFFFVFQILLLRQKQDKDELKCDSDTACVVIWQKVVNTLVKAVTAKAHHDHELQGMGH